VHQKHVLAGLPSSSETVWERLQGIIDGLAPMVTSNVVTAYGITCSRPMVVDTLRLLKRDLGLLKYSSV